MQASNPGLGTVLALLAGILLGTFAAPMKRIRRLDYCFWSLIVFAWLFGFATVPGLIPFCLPRLRALWPLSSCTGLAGA